MAEAMQGLQLVQSITTHLEDAERANKHDGYKQKGCGYINCTSKDRTKTEQRTNCIFRRSANRLEEEQFEEYFGN